MRLLLKYAIKYHRSITNISFLAKNFFFDAAFCLISVIKIINH